jgi:hypothetical protein
MQVEQDIWYQLQLMVTRMLLNDKTGTVSSTEIIALIVETDTKPLQI